MLNLSRNNEIVATIMFFPQGTVISTKGDSIMSRSEKVQSRWLVNSRSFLKDKVQHASPPNFEVPGTTEKVSPEILSERSFSIFRQAYELLTTEKGEERERETAVFAGYILAYSGSQEHRIPFILSLCGFGPHILGIKISIVRVYLRISATWDDHPFTQRQFLENICSEDNLRSRIFGTFVVKFLARLPLLGF